ncbi:hypothetical protein PC116_g26428 [Phytophthora cactorum]|nr:hypothetical protein PC114_g24578 [Phytophthora cactorum]KAG4225127.1 hypothetical protein PC116_g26428 [Phytophthora cactorum]
MERRSTKVVDGKSSSVNGPVPSSVGSSPTPSGTSSA